VQEKDDTIALVWEDNDGGMDAIVQGVVQVGPGGCLGLVTAGADEPVALIWPEGSRLVDGSSIDVPGVGVVSVGQSVEGGGGAVREPNSERYRSVPAECLSQPLLLDTYKITSASG
jgi:hypothetical protein